MKKIFLSLLTLSLFGLSQTAFAQGACTPVTDSTIAGLYPKGLPDGMVNVAYDEQIDFVMFADTVVSSPLGPLTLYACSFELIQVDSLPAGVTFVGGGPTYVAGSNPPKWVVSRAPGAVNKGCVRISGIPAAAISDDSIRLKVKLEASTTNPGSGTCMPSSFPGLLPATVNYAMHWHIVPFNAINAGLTAKQLGLKVVPNPAEGVSSINMILDGKKEVSVAIYDLMGRQVMNVFEGVSEGTQSYTVDTQNLNNGIYVVKVTLDGKSSVADKFVVRN